MAEASNRGKTNSTRPVPRVERGAYDFTYAVAGLTVSSPLLPPPPPHQGAPRRVKGFSTLAVPSTELRIQKGTHKGTRGLLFCVVLVCAE